MRQAAQFRLTLLLDPALKGLSDIIKDKKHPQRLGAIMEVLERNELYGYGVEPKASGFGQAVTVQTQVNLPEAHFDSMSDQDLETYRKLLEELRELLPAEEPKTLPGTRGR